MVDWPVTLQAVPATIDAVREGSLVTAVVPIAVAVGVFGIVYGAAAQPVYGAPLTIVSSLVVFSGAAQFTMVGLALASASPLAILWAVAVLNLRHLALGAALRPQLSVSRRQRFAAAWFIIDETVGLALTSGRAAWQVVIGAGTACYLSWVVGTAIGAAGGGVVGLESLAASVFPVLFIGLAAIMAHGAGALVRTALAAAITLVALVVWPGLGGLAPVLAAMAVSLMGSSWSS